MIPEEVAVLDFDMLCATVALRSSKRKEVEEEEEEETEVGGSDSRGVQRRWEGEVLNCLDDLRIATLAACGFFPFNFIAFSITKRHGFLSMGLASIISCGSYLGYFRTRIRNQFNIRGTESYIDNCFHHLICPCCTLCQESRTLEMNNIQDGIWHGRGDTICIGSLGEGNKEFTALQKSWLVQNTDLWRQ